MALARVFLITGIPGAGKTTVSRLLAARFPRAVHIEADVLQGMLVTGCVWPGEEPEDEAWAQLRLRAANAAALANAYADSGFVPVIDDVVVGRRRLRLYETLLRPPLRLVVLAPALEVALRRDTERGYKRVGGRWAHLDAELRTRLDRSGTWIDTSALTPRETVDEILWRTSPTRSPQVGVSMEAADVREALEALRGAGVRFWLEGGWGVDALVGRRTRAHGDIDLALPRDQLERAEAALARLGYAPDAEALPGLPARRLAVDRRGREIDLHPLDFDSNGNGWQRLGAAGRAWGCYPGEDLRASGRVGGRAAPCVSPRLQLCFRLGYAWRDRDEHDVALLSAEFGLPAPPGTEGSKRLPRA